MARLLVAQSTDQPITDEEITLDPHRDTRIHGRPAAPPL
jgi:hypothetical protein